MWWAMPLVAGYVLAVPFAVITASPALGRWFKRTGLCAIPEDVNPPAEVTAVLKGTGP
jgi:membrane glycosyltransferase